MLSKESGLDMFLFLLFTSIVRDILILHDFIAAHLHATSLLQKVPDGVRPLLLDLNTSV